MDLISNRAQISNDILESRFIRRVLKDTGADINKAQERYMNSRGFENNDWFSRRGFLVSDSTLAYTHLKKHRFVDMKTRNGKKGVKRKKNHPIHNRIIYGHYNNVIKELHFGFTEAIKQELRTLED